MGKYDNLIEKTQNNTVLAPFSDLINSILEYENDASEGSNLEAQLPILLDIVSARIQGEKERLIADMIRGFESIHLTKKDVNEGVRLVMQEAFNFIEQIEEEDKKNVLHAILNEINKVNEEAAERYHSYNFVLPITLEEGARVPTYAHDSDAAADLYAAEDVTIPAHSISNMVRTGVHIALPENWAAIIIPRSSIGMKTGLRLSNSEGLVDQDYRGPLGVIYDNISDSDYEIKQGDRIAQMYVVPVYRFKPQVVEQLDETDRNEGGFGSTGK